ENKAVFENNRRTGRDGVIAALWPAEVVPSERIGREQAVSSDVPGCRVTKATRMIEHGDADRLPFDRADLVDPGRGLPPRLLVRQSLGIRDPTAAFPGHIH